MLIELLLPLIELLLMLNELLLMLIELLLLLIELLLLLIELLLLLIELLLMLRELLQVLTRGYDCCIAAITDIGWSLLPPCSRLGCHRSREDRQLMQFVVSNQLKGSWRKMRG